MENCYERKFNNMKEEANIMSVKGTVRGVKNRVKTGIATFLQDQKKKVKIKRNILSNMCLFRIMLPQREGSV